MGRPELLLRERNLTAARTQELRFLHPHPATPPDAGVFRAIPALGATSGLAIDYFVSKGQERVDRPDFVRANAQALGATVQEWSRVMQRDLFKAVDAWFEDTRGVVAEFKIQRKIPTG